MKLCSMFSKSLQDISDSLGIRKDNVIRSMLKMGLVKDIDYIVIENRKEKRGRAKQLYYLSESCYKQLLARLYITTRNEFPTSSEALNIDYIKRYVPKETEILGFIYDALSPLYEMERQYSVCKYRIDLYLPFHKIAIECDENGHNDRNSEYELQREQDIRNHLQCEFIRFNPDAKDFKLSALLTNILKAVNQASVL